MLNLFVLYQGSNSQTCAGQEDAFAADLDPQSNILNLIHTIFINFFLCLPRNAAQSVSHAEQMFYYSTPNFYFLGKIYFRIFCSPMCLVSVCGLNCHSDILFIIILEILISSLLYVQLMNLIYFSFFDVREWNLPVILNFFTSQAKIAQTLYVLRIFVDNGSFLTSKYDYLFIYNKHLGFLFSK